MSRLAIIGAGLSGLVLARQLQSLASVTVFEKSRGPGGRIATRYAGEFEFDHGAQFFTARTAAFQEFLQPLSESGVIADWRGQFAEFDGSELLKTRSWDAEYPHYVGTPRMNSIGKTLSQDLDIRFETEITGIVRGKDGWRLATAAGPQGEHFDWLVITAPAAQTAALASPAPELVAFCRERHLLGCFALMLGFDSPLDLPFQAALVRNAIISWISVNSSKPGRGEPFTLLVHSTNDWANRHIDDERDSVLEQLLDAAAGVTGRHVGSAVHRQVHRWRYANIDKQKGPAFFLDAEQQIAACGDWCVRGRVEAAFTSAYRLAESLAERLV